jgi:pimeloyl-ACP methyl ester carboxylesterase
MSFITTKDGTEISYKDWGTDQPIVFHHGWPLSADDWNTQMLFFLEHGYRVIAHDRRGHGRSTQTSNGRDMDTYAQDAAAVADALNLRDAVDIGHSTCRGEVVRYVARYGRGRVAKAVLVSAVPPLMLKTDNNPEGTAVSVFDGLRPRPCSALVKSRVLTSASNAIVDMVHDGKLDEAEQAARDFLVRFAEVHDGYDRLGMVYEARRDNKQAANCYRQVIDFVQSRPDQYEAVFEATFQRLIQKLNPPSTD